MATGPYRLQVRSSHLRTYDATPFHKEFELRWQIFETSIASRARVYMNGDFILSSVHRQEFDMGSDRALQVQREDGSFHRYKFAPLPGNSEGMLQRLCLNAYTLNRWTL